ncbi:dTDP-rhamnosyl transferase RfbF [Pseudoalteromonas gelatinilytica]|uniref:dTDP-rhamnosyl transferase RfbF n=2 Tax=Pseudoalteromonas TaxID=53246 RepID=A0ABQ1TR85_9GAMM|nr:dTDP-rhamnosyl transferase RfbF [Pseudoalteromonas profundi]
MFYSVIPIYNPDFSHVKTMVEEIEKAGIVPILFDNTPGGFSFPEGKNKVQCKVLGDNSNQGLSVAFNLTLEYVREIDKEFEGIIFFDQDSSVVAESLTRLVQDYKLLSDSGYKVGVLGAQATDGSGTEYQTHPAESITPLPENFYSTWFVISSFSLVPKTTFDLIGDFDGRLFIDLVDSEFSFRCSKFGLDNIITRNVKFPHVIGESRHKFLGRPYAVSSPIRNYYQFRNIILVGRKYGWYLYMLKLLARRVLQFTLSGLHEKNLLLRYKYMIFGFIDGIKGKGGIYPRG